MQQPSGGEWTNWSGSVSCHPDIVHRPETEHEVQRLVREARQAGDIVRVTGSGHSWTPLVATDDALVSLTQMGEVREIDADTHEATVAGGITIRKAARSLNQKGLAFPNLGDVTLQTIAGAFATGTHGTGLAFGNLAECLAGGRLVTGTGEIREVASDDEQLLRALRVSLGALGILTEMRLDLQPRYKIERREYCTRFADVWPLLDELVAGNRNMDLYWYPRSDEVKVRLLNGPGGGTDEEMLPADAELVKQRTDWWHRVIPEHNGIPRRFEEMEYAIPLANGPACFREVRDRVRKRWRANVGWRLLVRTVGADDTYLSTEHDRDVMTISLIQNAQLDHRDYFQDIEPIFRRHGGRPHWGKNHSLEADELAELYPAWDRFQRIRAELDPGGVFVSEHVREVLGPPEEPP